MSVITFKTLGTNGGPDVFTDLVYHERPGSPQESFSGDNFRAKRIFDVNWKFRWMFIKHMLGTARLIVLGDAPAAGNPDTRVTTIERDLPDQYYVYYDISDTVPRGVPKSFMVAVGLENIEPLGAQRVVAATYAGKLEEVQYDMARITINYESVTYRVEAKNLNGSQNPPTQPNEYELTRYTTVFRQPSAEFLSLPFGSFKWVEYSAAGKIILNKKTGLAAGIPITGANGKIVAASEVILIHHKVPGIPKALKTHIGSVNADDWPQMGALKGQLLLTNIEIKPFRWLEETRLYDITFKFKFFDPDPDSTQVPLDEPRGHNWFLQHFPADASNNKNVSDVLLGTMDYKLITHNGYPPEGTMYAALLAKDGGVPASAKPGVPVYKYKDFSQLFSEYEIPTATKNTWMT